MRCPECLQRIHAGAEECPHCGVTFDVLKQKFSNLSKVVHGGVHDLAGVLRSGMRKQVMDSVEKCEKRFSNISVAISMVALDDGVTLESFGMWLLNEGEFRRTSGDRCGEGRVVIIIDVKRRSACLCYGYLMDGLVREGESFDVLTAGHASLLEGEYVRGCEQILQSLKRYLEKVWKRSIRGEKALAKAMKGAGK